MSLATSLLRYSGICFCSPRCRSAGGPHGWAYRALGPACYSLCSLVTLQTALTFALESPGILRRADAFCNLFALATTWLYLVVWRSRGPDLHRLLSDHHRFLDSFQRRAHNRQRALLRRAFRYDRAFTAYMYAMLGLIIGTVVLHSMQTRKLALPAFPLVFYDPENPPVSQKAFAIYTAFYCLALPCCGATFAGLSSLHVGLNIQAIYLLKCVKHSLRTLRLERKALSHAHLNIIIKDHQHIVDLIRDTNGIFAEAMMQRLTITYVGMGVALHAMSKDPLSDPKTPGLVFFMMVSLLQFGFFSEILKEQSSSVSSCAWESNWLRGDRDSSRKLTLLMTRTRRAHMDGIAATGIPDCVSMATVAQVLKASVSFLQALRSVQFRSNSDEAAEA